MVTPPPVIAVSVPVGTLRVTLMGAAAASTSLMLMPVSAVATSSVTAMLAGTVLTGASLTAVSTMISVAAVDTPPLLSMAVKLKLVLPLAFAVGLK